MSSLTGGMRGMLDGGTGLDKFDVKNKSNVVMSEQQSDDWSPTQQTFEKPKKLSLGYESGLYLVEFKTEYTKTSCSQRISPNLQLKNEAISCGIEVKTEDFCEINQTTEDLQNCMPRQFLHSEIPHETNGFDGKEIKIEIIDETVTQRVEKTESDSYLTQNKNNHNSIAELYEGHVVKSELVLGPETLQLPSEGLDPHTGPTLRKEKITTTESLRIPKLNVVCENNLGKDSYTQEHKATKHTKEIYHEFSVGQNTFTRKRGIDSHTLLRVHAGNKPHKCYVCQKTLSQKRNLREHMLTHTGEKPHKCGVCNKTFRRKFNLRTHELIHTGARPFKCGVCHGTFRQKSKLRAHLFVHTGAKPHKCDVCNRTFNQKHNLRTHMLTHAAVKPHKCDICQKSYNWKRDLRKHILTHTGDSRHRCSVCQKPFTLKSKLQKHFLRHTGYIPNKCFVCKKVLTTKSGLEAHMIIHTHRRKTSQV